MRIPEAIAAAGEVSWHALDSDEALAAVWSTRSGLTQAEAEIRLAKVGANELAMAEPVHPWPILRRQFSSVIVWLLMVATLVSGSLGEWVDAGAIAVIIVLNAVIGFTQEYRAGQAMAALRRLAAPHARVRRDGIVRDVASASVVPGDVLVLEAGDLVAADARLLRASSLTCGESALTGESVPVEKSATGVVAVKAPLADRNNMVFLGTAVSTGAGDAVVVATGMATELGRIAGLLRTAGDDETPLQRRLAAFGRFLVWLSLGIVLVLFGLGMLRQIPIVDLFLTSVSLAVAAVPEGLPAIVTVALALGVQRMAKRRALVRKLPAVETLGSTSVICTDKTGTLTLNEMTVRALHVAGCDHTVGGEGYAPDGIITPDEVWVPFKDILIVCGGCNDATLAHDAEGWHITGDPTDGALLTVAAKGGWAVERIDAAFPRLAELPFDGDRKCMTVIRHVGDGARALVKGAPDLLLERCTSWLSPTGERPLTDVDRAAITEVNVRMAESALRVLGAARRDLDPSLVSASAADVERDLVWIGLVGMQDPPRPSARDAVARCRSAGIRVVMITGDHPRTALAIAREIGIAKPGDRALTGAELDAMDDAALTRVAPEIPVYARVTAAHKLRIVRSWKATGAVVAMTGDGVNDAPAIKGADIGVAMGRTGTEVTKEAADIVVIDDDFATIVAAVEEGRGIYDNIRKTIEYLLAGNCGELLLMAVCILIGLPIPLLPVHLLWINLVTDGLPALCLATDPIDRSLMDRPPRAASQGIADRPFLVRTLVTGVLTAGVAFAVYLYALRTETIELARTHAFAVLVFAELLRSFGARSETRSVWAVGLFTNLRLVVVVIASATIQIASHHVDWLGAILRTSAMSLGDCLMLLVLGLVPLAVLEAWKAWARRSAAAR